MTKSKKQPPQLSINPVDERIKTEFLQYQKEHNISSKHKLLEIIWDNFKYSEVQFNDEEKQLIDRALKMSNISIEEFKKRAILNPNSGLDEGKKVMFTRG